MKKAILTQFLVLLIATAPIPVYASSLDDVINQNTSSQTQENNQDSMQNSVVDDIGGGILSGAQSYSDNMLEDLTNIADMSTQTSITAKVAGPMSLVTSTIVQIMVYVLTLGLPVAVLADLGFIILPFLRTGQGMGNQQVSGTTTGMNSGYGMSSGYGNRYGGYGGGFSNGYGSFGNAASGMAQQSQMQGQNTLDKNRFLFIPVSNEALMLASSQGTAIEKMKSYMKDSLSKIVISIGFATLLLTGALTRLSVFLGTSAGNAIINAMGNI